MRSWIVVLFVGGLSLNFVSNQAGHQQPVSRIEHSVRDLTEIVEVDRERSATVRKITRIIERFYPDMNAAMKVNVADIIYEMSIKYPNLDVDLICATITHESARTWQPDVVSRAGAMGLMQIMPRTGKWLCKYEGIQWTTPEEILFDPVLNIRLGTRYLSALIETYDLEGGLAAYNGGGKRAEMWLATDKAEGVLWDETRNYIPLVLKLYDEFKNADVM